MVVSSGHMNVSTINVFTQTAIHTDGIAYCRLLLMCSHRRASVHTGLCVVDDYQCVYTDGHQLHTGLRVVKFYQCVHTDGHPYTSSLRFGKNSTVEGEAGDREL